MFFHLHKLLFWPLKNALTYYVAASSLWFFQLAVSISATWFILQLRCQGQSYEVYSDVRIIVCFILVKILVKLCLDTRLEVLQRTSLMEKTLYFQQKNSQKTLITCIQTGPKPLFWPVSQKQIVWYQITSVTVNCRHIGLVRSYCFSKCLFCSTSDILNPRLT